MSREGEGIKTDAFWASYVSQYIHMYRNVAACPNISPFSYIFLLKKKCAKHVTIRVLWGTKFSPANFLYTGSVATWAAASRSLFLLPLQLFSNIAGSGLSAHKVSPRTAWWTVWTCRLCKCIILHVIRRPFQIAIDDSQFQMLQPILMYWSRPGHGVQICL